MKSIFIILSCALLISACKSNEGTPVEPASTGTATGVGKPVGAPVQKVIGPAGGTISTPGNEATLSIPAGALTAETSISIQPVENLAFGATGLGYELGPANLTLNKPATLSWNYKDEDVSGSAPEALGVAGQNTERKWKTRPVTLEKEKRKISASMSQAETIAFYEKFTMRLEQFIAPGEHMICDVSYQPADRNQPEDHGWLEPLTPYKDVKNWRLNGQEPKDGIDPELGVISPNPEDGRAGYFAPLKVPKKNEIAISAEVILKNTKSKLILVRSVKIVTPNAFEINGYKTDTAYLGAITLADGQIFMAALSERHLDEKEQASVGFSIAYPFPGIGEYEVSDGKTGPKVSVSGKDPSGRLWADNYTPQSGKRVFGPARVIIDYYNPVKRLVEGTVSGTLHYYNEQTKEHKTAKVSARFRAADPH